MTNLTREQVETYLKGQDHPHPGEDGTLDEFMHGGDRQAMYDEAVLKNYSLSDVDRWFHLSKVMGVNLSFETAMKIDRSLYEADLETMELNLPEERIGIDPYGRSVFRGSFEEVKDQIKEQVIHKDDFEVGQLADLHVPNLKLADAFQLYAQLRGETDGSKTLFLTNRNLMYDLSRPKDICISDYELKEIIDSFILPEDPLYEFIDREVPFRMREVLGIEVSDRHCLDLVEVVKENLDVMFDHDRFDSFLVSKYEELLGLDSERMKDLRGEISVLRKELDGAIIYDPDLVPAIDKRLCALQEELDMMYGVKPRTFIFDDEIILNDDNETINGYFWAIDALVARLPNAEDMENINFYAEYNVATGDVTLTASYDTPVADGELNKAVNVAISDLEKAELIDVLERYCKTNYKQSCLEFVNEIRANEGLPPLGSRSAVVSLDEQIYSANDVLQEQSFPRGEPRDVFLGAMEQQR